MLSHKYIDRPIFCEDTLKMFNDDQMQFMVAHVDRDDEFPSDSTVYKTVYLQKILKDLSGVTTDFGKPQTLNTVQVNLKTMRKDELQL